eukprot:scaffold40413_cov38-Tisochrysis_lutea.AAC.4
MMSPTEPPIAKKQNISMMHHRRWRYVSPASTMRALHALTCAQRIVRLLRGQHIHCRWTRVGINKAATHALASELAWDRHSHRWASRLKRRRDPCDQCTPCLATAAGYAHGFARSAQTTLSRRHTYRNG